MFLQPYGWTIDLPADHDEMDAVWATAKVATDNLYGRNYRQGPVSDLISLILNAHYQLNSQMILGRRGIAHRRSPLSILQAA